VDKKKRGAYRRKIKGERPKRAVESQFNGEFRYNNSKMIGGHPTFIFKKDETIFWCFVLTHSPRTRGKDNIVLTQSPNPEDPQKQYLRPVIIQSHRDNFGKILEDWEFHKEDIALVIKLIK